MIPDGIHAWPVEVMEWLMYAAYIFLIGTHHAVTAADRALGWLANAVVMRAQLWLKRPR